MVNAKLWFRCDPTSYMGITTTSLGNGSIYKNGDITFLCPPKYVKLRLRYETKNKLKK